MAGTVTSGAGLEEQEEVLQENKAMKKREEELPKQEQALEKSDKRTKRIRASAAGSSSPPCQPPPPDLATHIHQLPEEVLAKIFALFNLHTIVQVLSVCQRWRDVIEDWYLNKELVLEYGEVTTEEALCLVRSAQGLKLLELVERSDTVALLDAASTRCRNLTHLSVQWYDMDYGCAFVDTIRRVFQASPHITDLRLRCSRQSVNLTFYEELGAALPDLCKLDLDIDQLSDFPLDALVDSCSRNQMEELKVSSHICSEEAMAKLVHNWGRSLRVLELNAYDLTDGDLAQLAGCSELRQLRLESLNTPGGDCLQHLATLSHLEQLHFKHRREFNSENGWRFFSESRSSHILRKLFLVGWNLVDGRVLSSVAAFCPQLEELEALGSNITISGVREVLRCCRKLHNLYIFSMDASVAHIVTELPQLAPQLRRIHFGYEAKRTLDDATLSRVQAQMPHLRIE